MLAIYTSLYFYALRKMVECNEKRADNLRAKSEASMQASLHHADLSKAYVTEAAQAEKQAKALSKLL